MKHLRRHFKFLVAAVSAVVVGGLFYLPQFGIDRAQRCIEQFDFRSAESWLSVASSIRDTPKTHLVAARLHRKLGRLPLVARELQQAGVDRTLADQVQLEAWLADTQSRHSTRDDDKFLKYLTDGIDQAEVCEAYVRGCMVTYQLDAALRIIELWQADYPYLPQPNYFRGRLLEHRDNLKQAEIEYRSALKISSKYIPAAFGLAKLLEERREYAEAMTYYTLVREHNYHPQPGEIGVARCLRLQGRLEDASAHLSGLTNGTAAELEVAWMLVGDSFSAARDQVPLETAYLSLELNEATRAVTHFQEVLAINPRNWKIRYQLAMALRKANRNQEATEQMQAFDESSRAVADCEKLFDHLREHPEDANARYQIGTVLLKHVSESQGILWLQSALDYEPLHREALAALVVIFDEKARLEPQLLQVARRYQEKLDSLKQ